jgi:hypothetical protein
VDRKTALWCLTVFFGASIIFQALRSATETSSDGVSLAVQAAALAVMIVAIVLILRKRGTKTKK